MAHWYTNLEDKAEEHGPARHINLPPEEAQRWLADLLEHS